MKTTLPKLAKDLAALVGIAKKGTSVEKIEAALVEARERVSAAIGQSDQAEAEYQAGLLDETPAALAKLQDRKAAAMIERDRAEALVTALTKRLGEARNADERQARRAIYDDAVAKADAIKARFADEYRHHADALRGLLRDLAEAEAARECAGKQAIEFGDLPSVEDAVRSMPWTPEEIVATDTVHLWVIDGRVDPIPAEWERDVRPSTGNFASADRGVLSSQSETNAGSWNVTRRPFKRTRYREPAYYGDAPSLLRVVNLPALHPFGDAYATAEDLRSIDTSLAHFAAERRPDPVIERPVKQRLELIPPEPERRETVVPYPLAEQVREKTPSATELRAAHTPSRLMATEKRAG